MNNQISSFKQQLRVSVVGEPEFNFSYIKYADQLTKDMEIIISIINQVDDNLYMIKNINLYKAENIIREIQIKLFETIISSV